MRGYFITAYPHTAIMNFCKIYKMPVICPKNELNSRKIIFCAKLTALFPLKNEMYSKGIFFDGQKGGVFIYNQIPVMNYPQYRRMRRMVHECCNYDGGNCILRFRLRSTGMESNSITNQKALLSKYAAEHGFRNPMFFVDDGFSGTNFQRPGFQEMMKYVEDYSVST